MENNADFALGIVTGNNKEYISSYVEGITKVKINATSKVMVLPPIFDEGLTTVGPTEVYFKTMDQKTMLALREKFGGKQQKA